MVFLEDGHGGIDLVRHSDSFDDTILAKSCGLPSDVATLIDAHRSRHTLAVIGK